MNSRRAVSPILATVILLGISVVAGGLVFSIFTTGAATASTTNTIVIENAQAVKGSGHADLTATIKNGGSKPWTTVEMTVSKSDLSEPLLYESLHENIQGCKAALPSTADASCDVSG
ncbi:MAG: archaellin/type IV pilin N-terminal domain-containing protein, partial [Nitrosarchaeum sp.]